MSSPFDKESDECFPFECDSRDAQSHDTAATNDDSMIAEWRIPTWGGTVNQSKEFRNYDFRNPCTGETVVNTERYVDFFRDIYEASTWAQYKLCVLVLFLQYLVFMTPWMVIDPTTLHSPYLKTSLFIVAAVLAFIIMTRISGRIIKAFHSSMQKIFDKYRAGFARDGIKIEYCSKAENGPCFRIQRQLQSKTQSVPSSLISPQDYPPIYLHLTVPGDIHIEENEYHPSMILGQETWRMIKNTHTSTLKRYRWLEKALVVLAICFLAYTLVVFLSVEFLLSYSTWLGAPVILISFIGSIQLHDQCKKVAYQRVTDKVNKKLMKKENKTTLQYLLKLETSELPNRQDYRSLRYQLVRTFANGDTFLTTQDRMEDGEYHDDTSKVNQWLPTLTQHDL